MLKDMVNDPYYYNLYIDVGAPKNKNKKSKKILSPISFNPID